MTAAIWMELREGDQVVAVVATYKGAVLTATPCGRWSVMGAGGMSAGQVSGDSDSLKRGLAMDKALRVARALAKGAK